MDFTTGTKLGPYEILARIGAGGMGEVWKARDTRLDRLVAIKRLRAEHTARFAQEARAIAALNHPHICQIYDVGPDYLVMEYIDGQQLSGPLPLDEGLRIAIQIAGALGEAHSRGILHRDLKPANILVTGKSAKLLDFGLAKIKSGAGDSNDDTALTMDGSVMGTAAYMAPEQAQGKTADERSDVFSFGAVLYEVLSGKRAFPGNSLADVSSAVLRDHPAPLDSPAAGIVARCLAKLPGQRFQNMADLRTALEKIADAKPAASQPSIAVLPFANMSGDKENEYFSDGLAEELINLLTQFPGLKVIARTSAFAFRGKEQDIRAIAMALGVTTVLEGSVRRAGNRIRVTAQLISAEDGSHLFSERYDRQIADVFAMQDEIAAAIATTLRVTFFVQPAERRHYTPALPAYDAVLKARHCFNKLTPEAMAQGKEHLERAIALDAGYAMPHSELAFYFTGLSFISLMPARAAMPMARAAAERALEVDPSQPEALSELCVVSALYDYDWEEAERLFGAAGHGPISPRVRTRCALYLQAVGRGEEAVESYARAVSDDPLNAYFRMNLANALLIAGRIAEAARECRRILELNQDYAMAWLFLSHATWVQGPLEEAIRYAEKAVELMPWTYPARGYLAALLTRGGDHARAAVERGKLGDGTVYGAAAGLCMNYTVLGELDRAGDWAVRAIEQRSPFIIQMLRSPLAEDLRHSARWEQIANVLNLPQSAR